MFEQFYLTEKAIKDIGKIIKKISYPSLRQMFIFSCGASSIQMTMQYFGKDVRESEVFDKVGTNKKGTDVAPMVKYLENNNLKVEHGENGTIELLQENIRKNIPTIIALQAYPSKKDIGWESKNSNGHYVVAIGYSSNGIIFSDPASVQDTYLSNEQLEKRWHDISIDRKMLDHYYIAVKGNPKYKHDEIIQME